MTTSAQSLTGDTSGDGTEPGGRSWMQRDVFEVCSNGLPENLLSDIYEAINDVLAASEWPIDWDVLSQPDDLPLMRIQSDRSFTLVCEECDQRVVLYDPRAERGHEIALGDLTSDARRHARECEARQ